MSEDTFTRRVLSIVRDIPRGSVMTYGHVASLAGSPGASRAVGSILKKNYNPDIPCHRVIRSNGTLGRYNRGDAKKAQLLASEGYCNYTP